MGHALWDLFSGDTDMKKTALLVSSAIVGLALGFGGCQNGGSGDMHHDDMSMKMWTGVTHAVAVLVPTQGNNVTGTIKFAQEPGGVHITGMVMGLTPGKHGFHIHEFGDVTAPNGSSAGGHYNPEDGAHMHAGLDDPMRHAGDLGNIVADASGMATIDILDSGISIAGMYNPILGRGIVVHANEDDLKSQSPPAASPGNSGARVAVGVIGIAK
jgi:superoxide dismutase, Cu-Zn family